MLVCLCICFVYLHVYVSVYVFVYAYLYDLLFVPPYCIAYSMAYNDILYYTILYDTRKQNTRFQGLPAPIGKDNYNGMQGQWSVAKDDFINNLQLFDVYPSDNVIITQGYFKDTLPHTSVKKIAFLRLDGDLYESTRDALQYLYDKVVPGGYIYVDDYHSFAGCKLAVSEFLRGRGVAPALRSVSELNLDARGGGFALKGGEAVWWQKNKE